MRVVKVPLGDRSYSIFIGLGVISRLGAECRKHGFGRRCAVISDQNVARRYGAVVERSLDAAGFEPVRITVKPGETSKNFNTVEWGCDQLAVHRLERNSFVIALGGGVVGDLAGFIAATYQRGVPFVQIPTTLLAQVDSSVGGKVGVNLKSGKNLAGAFHQPKFVLCDLETLRTLPDREFRAGLAEVIKYGIIDDAALFRRLERDLAKLLKHSTGLLSEVVTRCCEIKAEVVREDETESGLRAILNFGHTIGHAIENSVGYGKYLHGEAISIGQVAAAKLSVGLLGLPGAEAERIRVLFARTGLPTEIRLSAARRARLFSAMQLDKKVSDGEINFVLAERIGRVRWGQKVPPVLIEEALGP